MLTQLNFFFLFVISGLYLYLKFPFGKIKIYLVFFKEVNDKDKYQKQSYLFTYKKNPRSKRSNKCIID